MIKRCPKCNSKHIKITGMFWFTFYECTDCNHEFDDRPSDDLK